MNTLVYTIACGEATKKLQKMLHPPSVLVLDEKILGVQSRDRFNVRGARARIREFVDIEKFDNIICVEPDVELPQPLLIGNGKCLEIERGYCPMSDLAVGYPKDVWSPWNGFVAIPKNFYHFIHAWANAYQWFPTHGVDEQVLLEALQGFPFIWRDIVHHRGASKCFFVPGFVRQQAKDFGIGVK